MAKIRRDRHGLYLITDGSRYRPTSQGTHYTDKDSVPARQIPGTTMAGVGKSEEHNLYLEIWWKDGEPGDDCVRHAEYKKHHTYADIERYAVQHAQRLNDLPRGSK